MAVIRVGAPARPLAPPRRVELGLAGLVALGDAVRSAGGPPLPADFRVDPVARSLATTEVARVLDEARTALAAHGVVDDDGPVDAVAANLAALTASPYRVRTSLLGPGTATVAHHWTAAQVAGSLVRAGERCTLSLFDARALGDELLALLPEPEHDTDVGRGPLVAPLDALRTLAAVDTGGRRATAGSTSTEDAVVADLLGIDPDLATAVQGWSEGVRAVLHVTVLTPPGDGATGADRPPAMLVWFLDRRGWWSSRTWTAAGPAGDDAAGTRMVEITPVRRDDLGAALGVLTTGAWL